MCNKVHTTLFYFVEIRNIADIVKLNNSKEKVLYHILKRLLKMWKERKEGAHYGDINLP